MASEKDWSPRVRRVEGIGRERLQYAVSLMREQRFDEARDELLGLLHEDEKSVQARMMLGSLYMRQQMLSDALDQFKYAIEVDPMQAPAHVRAGSCCLRLNDIEQARALLQTGLDLDPKQVNAHFGMAQVLSQTGDRERAISHLEEALRLDPQMAPARMMMAKLLSEGGNVDDAIGELQSFVNNNPDKPQASIQLAMLQARQGHHDKAAELLEGAAAANPEDGRIQDLLGRSRMQVKDYAGAEVAFTRAIDLKTEDRSAPLRLVEALVKQGKLEKARDILKDVPRIGRITGLVHRSYGDIFAAQKLYEDAAQSYRAAILNSPDGEKLLAEIEAEAGADADSEAKLPYFKAAFSRMQEAMRGEGRRPERGGRPGGRRGGSPMGGRRALAGRAQ
jgi:tetratricopeptide (TPR) repeat protein